MRIGHGYDVHKFAENRALILGGVKIPYDLGLLGHSDADVLAHAVSDALLGSLALGDIGQHFPDTDERYKGADSIKLLKEVSRLVEKKGYKIVNVDSTILCQRPKLKAYIPDMRRRLSEAMNTDMENVSVKATTEEKLGFTGSEEGIKAYCVVLLKKITAE